MVSKYCMWHTRFLMLNETWLQVNIKENTHNKLELAVILRISTVKGGACGTVGCVTASQLQDPGFDPNHVTVC